tara:strand:- start:222 stop:1001 length:780 start_codon:yes stop_codon:yes gene_type:complete
VGNIYLGGTGKTQLVIKLNKILKNDYDITVIKKYYKDQLDEQKLLSKTSNVILARNRLQEVKKIKKLKKNIAIFDDGLQDKTIKYKISIVCFNSLTAAGNEKMLPAGPLRENLSELKNYDAVFINGKKNKYLINLIKKYNHKIKIFEGKYILKNRKSFKLNKHYIAFCGIGTPDNFFNLLGENRINVQKKIIFPDHYDYKISDMYKLKKLALDKNCQLVTTEKDIMKIKKFKKFKVKYTEVDLKIDNELHLKKFLKNNL